MSLDELLPNVHTFHGIPVINYKPLSAKHEEHRCALVAPYDSGQEMIEKCDHPRHCGVNYAFDGYWPCANGAAIARLFKLDKYKVDKLPKHESDWEGIDEDGNAITLKATGRHDPCVLPRAVPMVEAMVALVLADHLLRQKGQCTDYCSKN